MTPEVKENLVAILTEIANAKNFTTNTDIGTVFMSAEAIISTLAYLIGPIAEMEQTYRRLSVPKENESVAMADVKAKASDEYKEWKKARETIELAHAHIQVLKRFKEDLTKEYERS